MSLMVLPKNIASFRSLGHHGKGLFVLYSQCSSSSSESEAVGNFCGCYTLLELDPFSFARLFFFNNSGGNN
jgi:hypothetical protein